jgi:hypothetical protein
VSLLVAMPDPTMGTKITAIVLEALLITFIVWAVIEEEPEAIRLGAQWWETVRTAHGDPKKLDAAAELFAQLVCHAIMAIMSVLGALGSIRAAGRIEFRKPHSLPEPGIGGSEIGGETGHPAASSGEKLSTGGGDRLARLPRSDARVERDHGRAVRFAAGAHPARQR